MERLAGKVALVTGGTAGIGAATVERFRREGASVVFTGSNAGRAAALCEATGAVFHAHHIDDRAGWTALMELIRGRFGRLDIAFANAGVEGADSNIEDIEADAWDRIIDVNLTGTMLTCKHAVAAMRANPGGPGGSIIINSSMNGILALPRNVGYSVAKGAQRLLAKSVAMHCADAGLKIRCNTIHPGVVETQMIREAMAGAPDPAAARAQLCGLSPLGRMGSVEEIAGLVTYLASDEAAFVTGAEYLIDGGSTAGLRGV
ncbi:SDR family oxidoreductase [Aromatoleum toluclasticum]|uniref:SDR family NAD(P)-dependent oxidoreductase n=1 Tax=Aromatoleum toluclasticum TaxID=92003 RepID=UPI000360EB1F|nr:SDR family oxidoreductase [Aromatoleum toluclasticum]MCC4114803.1 SDR family oxidoreductase [Aromatoleum toluclasticum]